MSGRHLTAVTLRAEQLLIPLQAAVELTHRCPLRCPHCYLPEHDRPDALSTARLLELVDELAALGCLFLTLTGGEPLLHPGCLAVAAHARRRGCSVTLLTCAYDLPPATAHRLAELHVAVEVSLHAASAGVFDAATGRRGSFQRVLAGIERLRCEGADVLLKMPLTRLNHHERAAVEELAGSLGLPLQVSPAIVPTRSGSLAPLRLRLEECALARHLGDVRRGAGEEPAHDGPPCAAGVRTLTVSADGEVLACPLLPASAGSVLAQPLGAIWRDSAWLQTLRRMRTSDLPRCARCDKLPYCGRCPGEALLENGDMCGPSSAACARAAALERTWGAA